MYVYTEMSMLEKGKAKNPQTVHSLTEGKALGSSLICLKCQNAVQQTPPEISWPSGGSLAGLESAVFESALCRTFPSPWSTDLRSQEAQERGAVREREHVPVSLVPASPDRKFLVVGTHGLF